MVTTADTTVRDLRPEDWPQVEAAYADGIRSGNATFEREPPSWEEWSAAHTLSLVAELDGDVAGWAALSPVSERCCYSGVAEDSVYVAAWAQGRGVGRELLAELVRRSEKAGIWTLQAGIFAENAASARLHISAGFRLVGVRERLGELNGQWRDVLLFERRSEVAG